MTHTMKIWTIGASRPNLFPFFSHLTHFIVATLNMAQITIVAAVTVIVPTTVVIPTMVVTVFIAA